MRTGASTYFDFLMKHRCSRRPCISFAQAVGVMPDLARVERSRVSQRMLPMAPKGGNRILGAGINSANEAADKSPQALVRLTPAAV